MFYEDYPRTIEEEITPEDFDNINEFLFDFDHHDFNVESINAKFSSKERNEFNV